MTEVGSGVSGLSRAERKRHTRALLVAAARRRVAADGFGALAVRDMAREADIVPTAFYRHFTSVDELALQVADDAVSALRELVDTLVTTADTPIASWPEAFLSAGTDSPEAWPALARGLLGTPSPVHGIVERAVDEARRRLGIALSRGSALRERESDEVDGLVDVVVIEILRGPLEVSLEGYRAVESCRRRLAAVVR